VNSKGEDPNMVSEKCKDFGELLKNLRREEELTQEYCITVIGCSLRSWCRWEKGEAYPLHVYRKPLLKLFPELVSID